MKQEHHSVHVCLAISETSIVEGHYAIACVISLFFNLQLFQATGQEIPAIITSCTRIINLYGKPRYLILV